jgi:putative membrane protein
MNQINSFERNWIPRIMLILHAVGVVGILAGYGKFFLDFTASNLLVNGILAAWMDWEGRHWTWIAAIVGGLLVEIIGVQTGVLFGAYAYGDILGVKLAGVPLILGALWWMSLLGFGYWSDRILERWLKVKNKALNLIVRAFVAASLMTALDGLIEPVAIRAGWWAWEAVDVPWSNYATWWIVAFAFHLLPQKMGKNIGAGLLVAIFVLFFLFLNWFPWTR